jgi:enamine deaminase RidA (YjgF/YER057c/UK114 family)
MALTDEELYFLRRELGFNLMTTSAIPYIGVTQLFDQVIQPYLASGTNTTSSTAVTAATTATPATLTLASAVGFTALARVVVDVDDREEIVTVQSVSGSTITALFKLTHSGTYPVILQGAEAIIRDILRQIRGVHKQITAATSTAGIKQVDVIHFFGATTSTTQVKSLQGLLMHWRDELASALGVPNLWRERAAAGQMLSVY